MTITYFAGNKQYDFIDVELICGIPYGKLKSHEMEISSLGYPKKKNCYAWLYANGFQFEHNFRTTKAIMNRNCQFDYFNLIHYGLTTI